MLFVDSIHRGGDWASRYAFGTGIPELHKENQTRFDTEGLRLSSVEFRGRPRSSDGAVW